MIPGSVNGNILFHFEEGMVYFTENRAPYEQVRECMLRFVAACDSEITREDRYILYRILSDVTEDPGSWSEGEIKMLSRIIVKLSDQSVLAPEAGIVSEILRRLEAYDDEEEALLQSVQELWESDERFRFYDES